MLPPLPQLLLLLKTAMGGGGTTDATLLRPVGRPPQLDGVLGFDPGVPGVGRSDAPSDTEDEEDTVPGSTDGGSPLPLPASIGVRGFPFCPSSGVRG